MSFKPAQRMALEAMDKLERIGVRDPTTNEILALVRERDNSFGHSNILAALRQLEVKHHVEESGQRRWRLL